MPTEPVFFATPADWRDWLAANHATAGELIVGFWKVGSSRPSITEAAPPGDRKIVVHWIASAKRPEPRRRRLDQLIDVSAAGSRIDFMKPASQR
ncbi:MAG: bacteriocin-protection protein [Streptosporangiaceae bacterium]|nr:bacteriocin-protection protein [Streptosporangiaceae bacterium]